MNRNRTLPRLARFGVPLGAVAILAAGCAARTTNSGPQAPGEKVVPVTLADQGRVVALQVGQEIQVSLGSPVRDYAWTVASYPRTILAIVSSDPKQGMFTFQARSKGQGLVGFTKTSRCGPPLLEAMPDGTLCPEGTKGLQAGAPVKPSLVTYTVRVS